jgi:hypothetical protein
MSCPPFWIFVDSIYVTSKVMQLFHPGLHNGYITPYIVPVTISNTKLTDSILSIYYLLFKPAFDVTKMADI